MSGNLYVSDDDVLLPITDFYNSMNGISTDIRRLYLIRSDDANSHIEPIVHTSFSSGTIGELDVDLSIGISVNDDTPGQEFYNDVVLLKIVS